MTTVRSNGWTPEDDRILTEIVLNGLREGKTQLALFKRAGRELDRTHKACGFRWNKVIRPHFTAEVKEAKRVGKYHQHQLPSLPVDETTEEAKEQLLSWEKLLADREVRLMKRDEPTIEETQKEVESILGDERYNEPKKPHNATDEQIKTVIDSTEIYRRARAHINMAQYGQVGYGIDKYPNPLNADTWSILETIDHIIGESIDKLHYLVMLRIKLEQQGE